MYLQYSTHSTQEKLIPQHDNTSWNITDNERLPLSLIASNAAPHVVNNHDAKDNKVYSIKEAIQ